MPLPGSTRHPVAIESLTSRWEKDFTVTVLVRRRTPTRAFRSAPHVRPARKSSDPALLRRQRDAYFSAYQRDIRAVERLALRHGLTVLSSSAATRSVVLRGSSEQYASAFQVELSTTSVRGKPYRVRLGDIYVPEELHGIVEAVIGFDNRPFARAHVRVSPRATSGVLPAVAARAIPGDALTDGLSPLEVAAMYNFPSGLDGTGQTIAIVECGGGFRDEELRTYFQSIGVTPPRVTVASFPGSGTTAPGQNPLDPTNCDIEVMLDIEVAGAIAPGADIVVYFARNSSAQSFLTTMTAILHDTVNKPSIISLSWGGPEELTTAQFKDQFSQMLEEAAALGITVCVSSGDNASADYEPDDPRWDKKPHIDFPASSPWALACGGTRIHVSGQASGHVSGQQITAEEVWHDGPNDGTGGGISGHFKQPAYQKAAGAASTNAMRGVPDVSGNAAPSSGYKILCDGQYFPDPGKPLPAIGGTSAVAPLWAALTARLNQALNTRLGHLNPLLYQLAGQLAANAVLTEVTQGDNGDYRAAAGWNACTGLGRPDGQKLLEALRKLELPHT
jgi:kumamolisin